MSQVLATALDISAASETLIEGEHSYLVLFQNSDELRATGGFIGSYARITIIDGHVLPITVEDIYAADGQFTGSIPAPPGVKEYLSSDRGLRLPDSNWEAHFPTSAKQVLQFFALGNSSNYEGVIVITDSYFQSLLELTGPIWLPDYQLSVTSENLGEVLRTDRDQFFAGSIQKQHLLEQFKNQLLIKLTADEFDFTQLLGITLQHATQKNILWYFTDENLQNIAHRFALDGALLGSDSPNFLGFIESNVGINKANKGISRALSLSKKGTTMTAYYYLENTNSPPQRTELQALVTDPDIKKTATAAATHLGYINYQRVVYPSGWQLTKIALPDQTQPQITTRNFSLSTGQSIQESGFLVTVPEQSATLLELTFTLPSDTSSNSLELYKQPGTSPVPIWLLSTDDQPFEGEPDLILEKNRVTML